MKKYLALLIFIASFICNNNCAAIESLPINNHIIDLSGKLTSAQKAMLNAKLDHYNELDIALIVPSLKGKSIEEISQKAFQLWGSNNPRFDNGALIVIALNERISRIETGKIMENDLTDFQAGLILKDHLNPHLKLGDFYGGLNESFDVIHNIINNKYIQTNLSSNDNNMLTVIFILFIGFIVGLAGFLLLKLYLDKKRMEYKIEVQRELDEINRQNQDLQRSEAPTKRCKPASVKPLSEEKKINHSSLNEETDSGDGFGDW